MQNNDLKDRLRRQDQGKSLSLILPALADLADHCSVFNTLGVQAYRKEKTNNDLKDRLRRQDQGNALSLILPALADLADHCSVFIEKIKKTIQG